MSRPEDFLKEEQPRFKQTVELLRKMKDAATEDYEPSVFERVQVGLGSVLGRKRPEIEKPQPEVVLADSVYLSRVAAEFFISRITQNTHNEQGEKLDDSLARFKVVYGRYEARSNSLSSPNDAGGCIRAGFLQGVSVFGRKFLEAHMIGYNNLGTDTLEGFLNSDTVVFAPLATDYLLAETYRVYIERFMSLKGFDLRPIALDRALLDARVLDGDFESSEIAVFVDMMGQQATRNTALGYLQQKFPDKRVHEKVNDERIMFNPNAYGLSLEAETASKL